MQGIPDAPAEAITAALEAAEEQAETLEKGGTPAFVKVKLQQVSGLVKPWTRLAVPTAFAACMQ
jgi:hypothetical protein